MRTVRLIPDPRKVALLLASTLIALLLAEGVLWLAGVEPGYLDSGEARKPPFVPGKKLRVRREFVTDGEGVFKANPAVFPEDRFPGGFRPPPIRYEVTKEPRILFLGDSFTWGHNADPIERCFVDTVRRNGYVCYNTGIPGGEPNQYAFLAEKYVPTVRPDYVAVMIFMGNDLNSHLKNPMRPHQNVLHHTNMGWYYAFDLDGRYMAPAEAYRFGHDLAYQHFKNRSALARKLFLTTRVGTVVGVGLAELRRWLSDSGGPGTPKTVDREYVRGALGRIRDVCERHHARMLVFLIPDHPSMESPATSVEAQRHLFDGYETWWPEVITAEHYSKPPDNHLNNAGHRLVAELILRVLRAR